MAGRMSGCMYPGTDAGAGTLVARLTTTDPAPSYTLPHSLLQVGKTLISFYNLKQSGYYLGI